MASFTDSDSSVPAADFVARITWSPDGSTSLGSVSYDPSQGDYVVYASHSFSTDGSQPFSVDVTDPSGTSASSSGSVDVSDGPLTYSSGEYGWGNQYVLNGQSFSGTVATFLDPDGPLPVGDYSATIDIYDSNGNLTGVHPTAYIAYDSTSQQFTVSCSCTLPDSQQNRFEVAIERTSGGNPLLVTSYVQDPGYFSSSIASASGCYITATEGEGFSNVVIASFTSSSPDAVASDFSATINGESGAYSIATTIEANNNGGFNVWATTAIFYEAGQGPVPITINGLTLYATADVTASIAGLEAAASPIVAVQNTPFSGTLATFTSDSSLADDPFSAVINWGDGVSGPGAISESGDVFTVTGSHTYTTPGNYERERPDLYRYLGRYPGRELDGCGRPAG